MALPSNNGIFIHEGLNCSPNYVPTAQSIPISTSDNTTVKSVTDATLSNIAEDYDATSTYAVGDCVLYQRVLYQCTTAVTTAGAWDSTKWTAVKAVDVGSGGGGPTSADQVSYDNTTSGLTATDVQDAIDEVVEDKADRVPEPAEYDSTATYAVGDYCIYNNTYYCCISAISTPEAWTQAHWAGLPTPQQDYLHSIDPVGIGTLSMNRASGSTIGLNSVAVGYNGTASGTDSHAEGGSTTASGDESHAEGGSTTASGYASHAEGLTTTASGYASHAEGQSTGASDTAAHAEGRSTSASGKYSHAEGQNAYATGNSSHAEGMLTTASGAQSHAEGTGATASGYYSHAEGLNTIANHASQHVFGEHNIADPSNAGAYARGNYVEIVGNGADVNSRSNARTLDWSGNEVLAGTLTQSSDEKLKDIINEELPDVSTIKAFKFTWKKDVNRDDSEHIGYLAQDVEKVLPYLVKEDAEGNKVLDYIAFLVAKVNSLENRLAELENSTTKDHKKKENNK